MIARQLLFALSVMTLASGSAAFAQNYTVSGPATVTSTTIQSSGCPTVSTPTVRALNGCAAGPTATMTTSFGAVVNALPPPRVMISRDQAINVGFFGHRLFGFGRVYSDLDNR